MNETKENILMGIGVFVVLIGAVAFFWWIYRLVTRTEIKTCEVQKTHNVEVSDYCILD